MHIEVKLTMDNFREEGKVCYGDVFIVEWEKIDKKCAYQLMQVDTNRLKLMALHDANRKDNWECRNFSTTVDEVKEHIKDTLHKEAIIIYYIPREELKITIGRIE